MSKSQYAANLGVTTNTVINWIDGNKKLTRALKEIGWNVNSKTWRPAQLAILQKYLGG